MGNSREDKNGWRQSTFGFDNEIFISIYFAKIELLSNSETKSDYLRPFICIFPAISQNLKGKKKHKHVET